MTRTPCVGVDVVPERQRDDVQLVLEVVEPDADRLGRLVERRPDVDVLAEPVPADRLDDQPGQLVDRRHVLHEQDPARLADALDVLAHLQPVELALLLVPVGADALERRGPVHERVGHDADLGVAHRDPVALEVADQVVERRRASARGARPARAWRRTSRSACGRAPATAVGASISVADRRAPAQPKAPVIDADDEREVDEVEARRRRAGTGRAGRRAGPSG